MKKGQNEMSMGELMGGGGWVTALIGTMGTKWMLPDWSALGLRFPLVCNNYNIGIMYHNIVNYVCVWWVDKWASGWVGVGWVTALIGTMGTKWMLPDWSALGLRFPLVCISIRVTRFFFGCNKFP